MITLAAYSVGQEGIIEDVQGDEDVLFRLFTMGFTPGTRARVMLCSPTGETMVVRLRGCLFSLRRSDAACVRMKDKRRK